jgi:hypothetical protein
LGSRRRTGALAAAAAGSMARDSSFINEDKPLYAGEIKAQKAMRGPCPAGPDRGSDPSLNE